LLLTFGEPQLSRNQKSIAEAAGRITNPAAMYNSRPMIRPLAPLVCLAALAAFAPVAAMPAAAQADIDLDARERLLPSVGQGVVAMRHDAAGRFYVLTERGGAVDVFDAQGKPAGTIPATPSKAATILYGVDLDVDSLGRVYVADRGADAVKIFSPDGRLERSISIAAPTAVSVLSNGEVAVTNLRSAKLVTVFNAEGRVAREFGDPVDISEIDELNRYVNIGRLARDLAGHLYYSFTYLPEPTVRRYDRFGYSDLQIELNTLDFLSVAQATRRQIAQHVRGKAPSLKPVVGAVGVDPQTGEMWLGIGGRLLRFAPDGTERGSYLLYTKDGRRIEASAILPEPGRLLVASTLLGVFELPRPGAVATH
jgi:hypothetical protein